MREGVLRDEKGMVLDIREAFDFTCSIPCKLPSKDTRDCHEAGSATVQPVVEKLASAFEQRNPGVRINIQGGGSSVGITTVAGGTVYISAASQECGSDELKLVTHLMARNVIAIIVHTGNS